MRRFLLSLYPAAWRRRYGDEFAALLEDRRPGLRQTLDIVRGAVDARLHPIIPREATIGRMAMVYGREEMRDELRAILAAHEDLGPEHQEHLVEGFLDRLEANQLGPTSRSARRPRRTLWGLVVAVVIAAGAGSVGLQNHAPLGAMVHAQPLPEIAPVNAQIPGPMRHLPLSHYTNRTAPSLFGDAIVSDYGGPHPYAFIDFTVRYHNCPATPRGAFRLTIERVGYKVTGQTQDGRLFIAHTGPLTEWSQPAVFWERNVAAMMTFPTPRAGLYYWKVEVPSARGCAWRIDYSGS